MKEEEFEKLRYRKKPSQINWNVIIGIIAVLFLIKICNSNPSRQRVSHVGEIFPAFSFEGFTSGMSTDNIIVGGQCVTKQCVTIFLSPRCGVCVRNKGFIARFAVTLEQDGIHTTFVVGPFMGESMTQIKRFAQDLPGDVAIDAQTKSFNKLDIAGVPSFISHDRDGEIMAQFSGLITNTHMMAKKLKLDND